MATTAVKLLKKGKKTETKAPEEKTEAKKKTTTKAPPKADLFATTVHQMETLSKAKALTLAKVLAEEHNFHAFKLGGVLSSIQAQGYWEGAKDKDDEVYDSFKSFMSGEYGLNYRKGMYLVGIYNSLVAADIPWAKVQDVGWTKLKEMSAVLTKENVDEWVERAMEMTTIQLVDFIKNMDAGGKDPKDKGKDGSAKLTTMTFKVHEDQKSTIQDAIDKAMKDNKTEASSVALDFICMNYLEGKAGKAKKAPKQKTLKQLAVAMGEEKAFNELGDAFPQYDITVVPAGEGKEDADTEM